MLFRSSHQRSGGSTIASFSYGYDRDGNRTNMTTLEGVNTYSYNSNNWLTAATYPDGKKQEFSYDKVGNRTNLIETTATTTNTTVYTYDNANREFSDVMSSMPGGQVVTNLYAWDGAGRLGDILVNEVLTRSFGYSFRSQMTSLTDTNGATFTYDFDGDGNRISAAAGGCLSSRYVYDGPNCVLELNGSNQVTRAYVNGPGIDQPIERIDFLNGTPRTRYVYHTDGLGSVVAMTDYTGAPVGPLVVKSYAYEAFGAIRSETGKVIDRYAFTAREALGDSLGFYFYRNRVMDPNVGRFTSEDPLGFVDGPSLYEYVANKPLDFLDALGLDLGETKCDCNDLCTVLKAVESGKKTLDDLLASGENFAGRDGLVKRLAEKGVRIAGTRGLLSGSLTQTGKSLPKGQGAIYQYFESGEFNQLPGTHDHPSLTLGGEPDTRARMWGDAESTRVGVAINQLKDEVNKRNCKCK